MSSSFCRLVGAQSCHALNASCSIGVPARTTRFRYGFNAGTRGFASLKVNGSRLMDSIHESCEFGKAHAYGE